MREKRSGPKSCVFREGKRERPKKPCATGGEKGAVSGEEEEEEEEETNDLPSTHLLRQSLPGLPLN